MENGKLFVIDNFQTQVRFVSPGRLDEYIPSGALTVLDSNTASFFPIERPNVVIPAGEEHKTWWNVLTVIDAALERDFGRDSCFTGFGGGVVCDMTAFAASIYMRGARLVLVPTTLLAMVDASLGGKTGIDYGGFKNFIGTFYPADTIVIATEFLATLSEGEYRSGLAECIKHALLGDSETLKLLRARADAVGKRDRDVLQKLIRHSLDFKYGVIKNDLKESGNRGFLNLGHTFGHALETTMGLRGLTHGEGVAWGIRKALQAGHVMGVTPAEYLEFVEDLLVSYGYRLEFEGIDPGKIMANMYKDKKRRSGEIRFVLQRGIGDTFYSPVPTGVLKRVLSNP